MKNIQEYEKNLESLCRKLGRLKFSDPVHMVYNPLDYARKSHLSYMEQYFFNSPKKIIFLGMNPGPFGMAQTGVPFGEILSLIHI